MPKSADLGPNAGGSLLLVDDESRQLAALVPELTAQLGGREVLLAATAAEGLIQLDDHQVGAVVCCLNLSDGQGCDFLTDVQRHDPGIARLVLCGEASRDELIAAAQVAQQLLSQPSDASTIGLAVARVMAVRRKLAEPALRELMGSVKRLPTVPDTYGRIVTLARDPDYRVKDIAGVIASDVASSVELLKLANSAVFALPRSVVSVEEAVNLLGINAVSNLILAGSLFRAGSLPAGLDAEAVQRVALASAAVARAVAIADGWSMHDADQVALAAMLRDVGLLVLAEGKPGALAGVDMTEEDPLRRAAQEAAAFGCTVPAASAYLLGLWNFPQTVVHAVGAQPLVPDEPGSTPTEQILSYACHRVLAGPDVRPPTPMLDPYRGLRWSTAAASVLSESDAEREAQQAG